MLDRIARLIDVKSIVTLGIVAAFVYLAVTEVVTSENFMQVVLVIITFYFAKKDKSDESENIMYVEMPITEEVDDSKAF